MYLPNRAFESIEGENEVKYTLQRHGQITLINLKTGDSQDIEQYFLSE